MPHLEFNPLAIILMQMAIILLVSRVLTIPARALGQPVLVAEILAGVALGPSLLGALWPEAMTALFPATSLAGLQLVSKIGLVLFMFLIGLELDVTAFKGRAHTFILISHTSIVVPFGLGALAAFWLWPAYSQPGVPLLSFVLFLGVAMSITAFPVLARILSERRLLTTTVGATAIACAAIDDVTAWCILAFVVAVARARQIDDALWTTAATGLFIVTMIVGLKPMLRRSSSIIKPSNGITTTVMTVAMLLLMICSAITELIGVHALFGAFALGAVAPRRAELTKVLVEKLESITVVLLLPLFFAYSGLRTELGLMREPEQWLIAAGLIVLATVGKFGGSAVAARLSGLRWREASAIGILMNTRGLMELVVLNIGMDLGVISPAIFTMLVIMAVVTTVATTPLLRWVYPEHATVPSSELAPNEISLHLPAP
jgi:Kef-type K+ transport system membrane component KefB